MELAEIIEAVKGTDPEAFKDALHKESQKHYQMIFNAGHSTATGAAKEKQGEFDKQLETLNAQLEDLKGQLVSKDEEIGQIVAKTPDLDKIKSDYEQKLIAKDELVKQAKLEAEQRVKELKGQITAKEKSRLRESLVNKLMGLHADEWAATKAVDDDIMNRIQIGEDGSYKVYQPDGSTPYTAPEGESPLSLLAREIVETIPAPLIRPPKNNGSGYQGGGEKKGNSTTKKRSEFSRTERIDFITENGREAYEALPI